MSEGRFLRCDSCRRTLPLPTNRETAGPWQRLSKRTRDGDLIFRDWCGQCNNTELWKRMEEL